LALLFNCSSASSETSKYLHCLFGYSCVRSLTIECCHWKSTSLLSFLFSRPSRRNSSSDSPRPVNISKWPSHARRQPPFDVIRAHMAYEHPCVYTHSNGPIKRGVRHVRAVRHRHGNRPVIMKSTTQPHARQQRNHGRRNVAGERWYRTGVPYEQSRKSGLCKNVCKTRRLTDSNYGGRYGRLRIMAEVVWRRQHSSVVSDTYHRQRHRRSCRLGIETTAAVATAAAAAAAAADCCDWWHMIHGRQVKRCTLRAPENPGPAGRVIDAGGPHARGRPAVGRIDCMQTPGKCIPLATDERRVLSPPPAAAAATVGSCKQYTDPPRQRRGRRLRNDLTTTSN
jgi:hypothetical protein